MHFNKCLAPTPPFRPPLPSPLPQPAILKYDIMFQASLLVDVVKPPVMVVVRRRTIAGEVLAGSPCVIDIGDEMRSDFVSALQ